MALDCAADQAGGGGQAGETKPHGCRRPCGPPPLAARPPYAPARQLGWATMAGAMRSEFVRARGGGQGGPGRRSCGDREPRAGGGGGGGGRMHAAGLPGSARPAAAEWHDGLVGFLQAQPPCRLPPAGSSSTRRSQGVERRCPPARPPRAACPQLRLLQFNSALPRPPCRIGSGLSMRWFCVVGCGARRFAACQAFGGRESCSPVLPRE